MDYAINSSQTYFSLVILFKLVIRLVIRFFIRFVIKLITKLPIKLFNKFLIKLLIKPFFKLMFLIKKYYIGFSFLSFLFSILNILIAIFVFKFFDIIFKSS